MKKGFTLIELIVVIGILSILAMIAIPNVINYIEMAKESVINTNFKTCFNEYKAIETLVDAGLEKNENNLEKGTLLNVIAERNNVYAYCFLDNDKNNNWSLVYYLNELTDIPDRQMAYPFN